MNARMLFDQPVSPWHLSVELRTDEAGNTGEPVLGIATKGLRLST